MYNIHTDFPQNSHPYAQQTPLGYSPRGQNHGGPSLQPALSASQSSTFSTLRVKVADEYRIPPPVEIPAALENVPETAVQFDLDFERGVLEENSDRDAGSLLNEVEFVDPWQAKIEKFSQHGFSQNELFMGLTACSGNDDAVVEFVKNYKKLITMGFVPALVVGALIKHKGDLHQASDACLALEHES
ncbi:hypothetical protein BSKO_10285 [Bryopsis sp. KO-2023]|nr:hypothetical protein BSKO_10285 [Bryopsis sp. KO-2023]